MANVNFNGQSASGGATSLNQLTDVNITSPSDDQVLTYDSGEWINKAVPSPTVPDDLNDLDDVNISTPSDGQIFKYNGTSSKWENANPPTIPDSADDISYDNTTSGLTADDVQEALDEIDGNVDTLSGKVYKTDDSTETTIASDDLLPIYDTSATASKKITVANVIKATVSNPNLLDNPWFTVNQRGQNTYTATGWLMCVDRWLIAPDFTLTTSSNGITITNSSANFNNFCQWLETDRLLWGKTYTMSILLSDGTIKNGSFTLPANAPLSDTDYIAVSEADLYVGVSYRVSNNNLFMPFIAPNGSTSISLRAVKLEVGSISTLALDTAPNYATELLKCQRYFVRIGYPHNTNYEPIGAGFIKNANRAYIYVKLPTTMRTTPVITQEGKIYVQTPTLGPANAPSVFENVSAKGTQAMLLYLKPDTADQFTTGVAAVAQFNQTSAGTSQSHIDFSADL